PPRIIALRDTANHSQHLLASPMKSARWGRACASAPTRTPGRTRDMIAGIRGREPDTVQRLVMALPRHSGG
ncbi:MAG: hypothetical protein WA830_23170, partial [Candidatus Sulfotelmatobacter sp.]